MTEEPDYSDLGFPGEPPDGWPDDPYFIENDGGEREPDYYCNFCGNARWKFHAPWCQWADAKGL